MGDINAIAYRRCGEPANRTSLNPESQGFLPLARTQASDTLPRLHPLKSMKSQNSSFHRSWKPGLMAKARRFSNPLPSTVAGAEQG